jgi:hypothetical protein
MPTKAWNEETVAISKKETELDLSGKRLDAGDFVSIASAISSKALLKLNLRNTLLCAEGGTILAAALGGNQMMTELNIANNHICVKAGRLFGHHDDRSDMSGVIAVANSIKNMGALSFLDISNNDLGTLVLPSGWKDTRGGDGWLFQTRYQHSDSTKQRDNPGKPEGAIAIANAIRNMGAMSVLNLAGNSLGGYLQDGWNFIATPEGMASFCCIHCCYITYHLSLLPL